MVEKSNTEIIKIINLQLKELGVNIINESDIKIIKVIGQGGFGKVYEALFNDKKVAVKELMLSIGDENVIKEITNEISVIQKAAHERLPLFHGVITSTSGNLCLVFEFINGPTLKDNIKNMDEKEKFDTLVQLLEILESMHNKKLIHRDIKPANIMIEEGNKVRLIDFGVSKIASKTCTFTKTQMGTTAYMAPECFDVDIEMDPSETDKPIAISGQVDIWAVGTMASEIFSGGIIPWSQKCKTAMAIEIKLTNKKPFPIPEQITNEKAKKVIKASTIIDPTERAKAKDLIKIIKEEE